MLQHNNFIDIVDKVNGNQFPTAKFKDIIEVRIYSGCFEIQLIDEFVRIDDDSFISRHNTTGMFVTPESIQKAVANYIEDIV